jgi:hypothetical protein
MFMRAKGVFASHLGHSKVSVVLVSHAWLALAVGLSSAYLMGSPAPLDPIAAVPFIGATSHGREL